MSEPDPIFFESPEAFRAWLQENHDRATEVWVGYWKKATGKPSLTWSEAVDQALCFGWIDSRANAIDAESYCQRFTPRRPGSNWSKINIAKVERLMKEGLMHPAGLAAFEAAKASGNYSFEQEKPEQLPREFERRLRANEAAWEHWRSRPPGYRRTAAFWVMSAKRAETRERRLEKLIESSAAGEAIPPLRRA